MEILKIYLAGLVVLVGAIVLNVLAGWLGLTTWYDFLGAMAKNGVAEAIKALRVWDWLFLFAVYPASLGAFAYLILRHQT
ncbi:MAG: hypothetical protein WHX52_05205 [Anaerolineae bacterium]